MTSDQSEMFRRCPACGRSGPRDANLCQYCGYNYRAPGGLQQTSQGMDVGFKMILYILSFAISIAGIIIGVVYSRKPDAESREVGKVCLILGIVSLIIEIAFVVVIIALITSSSGWTSNGPWTVFSPA